jgi:hypothetical protein
MLLYVTMALCTPWIIYFWVCILALCVSPFLFNPPLRISSSIIGKIPAPTPPVDLLTILKRVPEMDVAERLPFTQQFVDRVLSLVKDKDYRA